jgi:hypothetical protein
MGVLNEKRCNTSYADVKFIIRNLALDTICPKALIPQRI